MLVEKLCEFGGRLEQLIPSQVSLIELEHVSNDAGGIMAELWKQIEDYERYEVSTEGRVRNTKTGRLLKFDLSNCGYHRATLCKNNSPRKFSVHRLVAEAFIDAVDGRNIVNHIDSNKTNNHVRNLEWVNYSENFIHAQENGKRPIGSKRTSSLIDEDTVHKVCEMFVKGKTRGEILSSGLHPELKKHMVDNIRRRRTWKHVSKFYKW